MYTRGYRRKSVLEKQKQPFSLAEVKTLMLQLLSGVEHLHDNWVLHRDLKTSNLLYERGKQSMACHKGEAEERTWRKLVVVPAV